MSQIPFVQELGDELERSTSAHLARRRSRLRRRLTGGTFAFMLLAAGTAAATGVFSKPEQLASSGVACYYRPSLEGGATMLSTGDRSPVETCAAVLDTRETLTACAAPEHVAVMPGGPGVCRRAGLKPLPVSYVSARARIRTLERDVAALERSAGCVPPEELAQQVQTLLDRTGWKGWQTEIRSDSANGGCGTVTGLGGDGERSLDGSLDADRRVIFVFSQQS